MRTKPYLSLPERVKLLLGILNGQRAFAGPFRVLLDVTRRCNLACVGCRFHSPEFGRPSPADPAVQDMPVELMQRLCAELSKMGTRKLSMISEGESLLHPSIFELVRIAKDSGLEVTLLTNGTVLTEHVQDQLIESGLDLLRISCWGTEPEEWSRNYPGTNPELLRRVPDYLGGLNASKHARGGSTPRTVIHCIVNRHNLKHVNRAVEMAAKSNCDEVSFSVFKPRDRHEAHALSPLEEQELVRELRSLEPLLKKHSLAHNLNGVILRYRFGLDCWSRLPCYIGWVDTRIKMDGTVLPCAPCDIVVGDLREQTLREIWNGPAYRDFRRRASSRKGLAGLQTTCDCGYCCHVPANHRIHRSGGWLGGLLRTAVGGP
jgi:MoaA/NifB/PqqE/SkfB family radical SAM enzyme